MPQTKSIPSLTILVTRTGQICKAVNHTEGADNLFLDYIYSEAVTGIDFGVLFRRYLKENDISTLSLFLNAETEFLPPLSLFDNNAQQIAQLHGTTLPIGAASFSFSLLSLDHLQQLDKHREKFRGKILSMSIEQEKKLQEATASLIETNVALRREIREKQLAHEALLESEGRFRALTETTSDFIWEIDSNGNYTYASPKCFKLLGMSAEELIGKQCLLFRDKHNNNLFAEILERNEARHCGFSKQIYQHTTIDGNAVVVESSGEPIFSMRHGLVGFRGIDRDITERIINEKKLKEAKELAEAANRSKSEFLANMSHELRTPLHAILSYASYGEKRINRADTSDLLRFFQQIKTSGKRLMPLIDSLLDLAKLEAGKMQYDFLTLDLDAELKSAILEMTPLAEQKGIIFNYVDDGNEHRAVFDQHRISQVIRNLLSNAIKFSNNDTEIIIYCRIDGSGNYLETIVKNSGAHIPQDERSAIFDKFVQSSLTRSGAGGTGLGLAICKQITEDHRGKIWVDEDELERTSFHFTLPLFQVEN